MHLTLTEMSIMENTEINSAVADLLDQLANPNGSSLHNRFADAVVNDDEQYVPQAIDGDYCSNAELAYRIIIHFKISVFWRGGVDDLWCARTVHTPGAKDKNPLRAAMIAFLLLYSQEGISE